MKPQELTMPVELRADWCEQRGEEEAAKRLRTKPKSKKFELYRLAGEFLGVFAEAMGWGECSLSVNYADRIASVLWTGPEYRGRVFIKEEDMLCSPEFFHKLANRKAEEIKRKIRLETTGKKLAEK